MTTPFNAFEVWWLHTFIDLVVAVPVVSTITLGIPLLPVQALVPYAEYSRTVTKTVAELDKYEFDKVIGEHELAPVVKVLVVIVPATWLMVTEFPVALPFVEMIGEYADDKIKPLVTVNDDNVPDPTIRSKLLYGLESLPMNDQVKRKLDVFN